MNTSSRGGHDPDEAAKLHQRLDELATEERRMFQEDLSPVQFIGHSTHTRGQEIEHERNEIVARLARLGVQTDRTTASPRGKHNLVWAWALIGLVGLAVLVTTLTFLNT